MDQKKKRRAIAIAKKLKEEKGLTIKLSEIDEDIKKIKKNQAEILKIKTENQGSKVIEKAADDNYKKLQDIIDTLNEYMEILHPAGLIDYGSGPSGKKVVSQG